jgi:endoglucanase
MITLRAEPIKLLGDVIAGKSLDDRAGLTSILYAVDRVKDSLSNIDLEIMASAQEEVGVRGPRWEDISPGPILPLWWT